MAVEQMVIGGVVAMTRDGTIGREGALPWRIPSDLLRFKRITSGEPGEEHAVIMGRETWMSLPSRFRPLPGRSNLVLSRTPGFVLPEAEVHSSIESALSSCQQQSITHAWVIGGREVYASALDYLQILHVTWVEAEVDGDVRFPEFAPSEWEIVEEESIMVQGDDYPTTYVLFKRRGESPVWA